MQPVLSAAAAALHSKERGRRVGEGAIRSTCVCALLRRVVQQGDAIERRAVPVHLPLRASGLISQSQPALVSGMQRLRSRKSLGDALLSRRRQLQEGVARGLQRRRRRRRDERKAGSGFSLRRADAGADLRRGGLGVLRRARWTSPRERAAATTRLAQATRDMYQVCSRMAGRRRLRRASVSLQCTCGAAGLQRSCGGGLGGEEPQGREGRVSGSPGRDVSCTVYAPAARSPGPGRPPRGAHRDDRAHQGGGCYRLQRGRVRRRRWRASRRARPSKQPRPARPAEARPRPHRHWPDGAVGRY